MIVQDMGFWSRVPAGLTLVVDDPAEIWLPVDVKAMAQKRLTLI